MKRREFITLLGSAAAWPLAARGQQPERVRRVGVLVSVGEDDPEGKARLAAFQHRLQELGWFPDVNVRVDRRWGPGDADRFRGHAAELVALAPGYWRLAVQCSERCFRQRALCRSYSR